MRRSFGVLLVMSECLLLGALSSCGNNGGGSSSSSSSSTPYVPVYVDDKEDIDLSSAIEVRADLGDMSSLPLLKKIAMYNAGCIGDMDNYARDLPLTKALNPDSLRVDLSIGKNKGNGGYNTVTDEYEYYDYDPDTGKYKIDTTSLHYDWVEFDELSGYMKAMGALPVYSWCYLPIPLQYEGRFNKLDHNIENWQDVWEEIYYQYAKHCLENGYQAGYNEIYNEPDLEILKMWGVFEPEFQGFLDFDDFCPDGKPDQGIYPDMYEYGAKGILRGNPDACIGGPAFALGEIGVESWVGFLPRVLKKNLPLDFFSFHSYLDGNTWFMSDEARARGEKNEMEKVVAGMASDKHFLKTEVHINEYSSQNDGNGAKSGNNSQYCFYQGAQMSLNGIWEVANRTSAQWVHWAQMMGVAKANDPYSIIDFDGNPKAAYNVFRIYNDMPMHRYGVSIGGENSGLQALVSSDEKKTSICIWNNNASRNEEGKIVTDGDRLVKLKLDNPKFGSGERRLYRIDQSHASYNDHTLSPVLEKQNIRQVNLNDDHVWGGNIPAQGVVYITINKDKAAEDFVIDNNNSDFAQDIKTQYWFEDRYRGMKGSRENYFDYRDGIHGSYSHFDRKNWKMYLGMGDCVGKADGSYENQAVASGCVTAKKIPNNFTIKLETEGKCRLATKYSALGVRIDFYNESQGKYDSPVFFHNGIYKEDKDPMAQDAMMSDVNPYPWGTEQLSDRAVQFEGNEWNVNLSEYAPSWWNAATGKAQISFYMRNTGAKTHASFQLIKNK